MTDMKKQKEPFPKRFIIFSFLLGVMATVIFYQEMPKWKPSWFKAQEGMNGGRPVEAYFNLVRPHIGGVTKHTPMIQLMTQLKEGTTGDNVDDVKFCDMMIYAQVPGVGNKLIAVVPLDLRHYEGELRDIYQRYGNFKIANPESAQLIPPHSNDFFHSGE